MPPVPIQVVIEATQYTPDREPVLIHWAGKGVSTGPFSRTNIHSTTQTDLIARSAAPGYWSDDEVKAELQAHLDAIGILAEIVPNTDTPPDAEEEETGPGNDAPA